MPQEIEGNPKRMNAKKVRYGCHEVMKEDVELHQRAKSMGDGPSMPRNDQISSFFSVALFEYTHLPAVRRLHNNNFCSRSPGCGGEMSVCSGNSEHLM